MVKIAKGFYIFSFEIFILLLFAVKKNDVTDIEFKKEFDVVKYKYLILIESNTFNTRKNLNVTF